MDDIELGQALFKQKANVNEVNTVPPTRPTNTTTITGKAVAASESGTVTVDIAGNLVDIDTTTAVSEGDEVLISVTNHTPVVTGVIGAGDKIVADIQANRDYTYDAYVQLEAFSTDLSEANQAIAQSQVDITNNSLSISELNKYFRASIYNNHPQVYIGAATNPLQVRLTDSEIDFVDSGSVAAYISAHRLYIENAKITDMLFFGKDNAGGNNPGAFAWIARENGNLSLKWVGTDG